MKVQLHLGTWANDWAGSAVSVMTAPPFRSFL